MSKSSSLRTPIKRARGLGSAHFGTEHFWAQRLSAVTLIPLSIWFMVALLSHLVKADENGISQWLHHPLNALALGALIVTLFVHARLGIQTVLEDYLHCEVKKIVALVLLNLFTFGFGAAALMALAHLHFSAI